MARRVLAGHAKGGMGMKFLSWGCGVQSTTLGEMSAQGVLESLDTIITADTQWEARATYEIREFYAERWRGMGMRVEVVTAGSVLKLGAIEHIHIPFFTDTGAPLRRQCTREFKLTPIKRRVRELMGFHPTKPPHPKPGSVEVWLGISLDEWTRAKPSRTKFIVSRWPLLETRMTRQDCIDWLKARSLPVPPKSACLGCPYRSASEWLAMKLDSPDEFAEVVAFDEANRHNPLKQEGVHSCSLFVYQHSEPLITADLEADAKREKRKYGTQIPMMFCESGLCWV